MNLPSNSDSSAIIGLAMPIVISIVIQAKMSKTTQSIVALGACLVATLVANMAQGDPLGSGLGTTIVATFVAYKTFYEPTGISEKIEDYTNIGSDDE